MASYNWDVLKQKAEDGNTSVPVGQYRAQIVDATVKETSSKKDQVSIQWKVLEGPQAGGVTFQNIVLSPDNDKAMFFFFKTFEALGLPRSLFKGDFTLEQAAAMLKGKVGAITVTERPNTQDPTKPWINVSAATIIGGTGSTRAVEV